MTLSTQNEAVVERNVESRTILGFHLPEDAVKDVLPSGWQSTPFDSGPSKSANCLVILTNRILVTNESGEEGDGPLQNTLAVFVFPAKNTDLSLAGAIVAHGLSANKDGAPGPYGVFESATCDASSKSTIHPNNTTFGNESWEFRGATGNVVIAKFDFELSTPSRSQTKVTAFSGYDPTFFRVYRGDQGADVIRGTGIARDRLREFTFKFDGPLLGQMFNGVTDAVSVIKIPWTVRTASLPAHVALLGLQPVEQNAYSVEYVAKSAIPWMNSPIKPEATGILLPGTTVYLDRKIDVEIDGMGRARVGDELKYLTNLQSLELV